MARDTSGLRRGNPGNKGGGRQREATIDALRTILESRECQEQVKRVLHDADHPAFVPLWRAAMDRVHGKPEATVKSTVDSLLRVVFQTPGQRG